jgi:hypothetical protein
MHKSIIALRTRRSAPSLDDADEWFPVGTSRVVVDLPADDAWYEQLGRRPAVAPAWNAIAHVWHKNDEVASRLDDEFEVLAAWRVDEHIAWDNEPSIRAAGWSDTVKQISFVGQRTDITPHEFATTYRAHVDIARPHHAGASKYAQNLVVPDPRRPSPIGAISEFWFRSVHDLVHRYYAFDDSSAITRLDSANFLDPTTTTWMLVREYWVRV